MKRLLPIVLIAFAVNCSGDHSTPAIVTTPAVSVSPTPTATTSPTIAHGLALHANVDGTYPY